MFSCALEWNQFEISLRLWHRAVPVLLVALLDLGYFYKIAL